jgi:hypothetical protein
MSFRDDTYGHQKELTPSRVYALTKLLSMTEAERIAVAWEVPPLTADESDITHTRSDPCQTHS